MPPYFQYKRPRENNESPGTLESRNITQCRFSTPSLRETSMSTATTSSRNFLRTPPGSSTEHRPQNSLRREEFQARAFTQFTAPQDQGLHGGAEMKALELFTGCGGLAKGLELSGFQHKAFVENNRFACETLRRNFPPEIVHEKDIRDFDFKSVGHVDVIAGGPPCQPFSLGGLARAFNDERDMFPEAARAISELTPRGFMFENVKGLLRKSFSEYFEYIILRLTYPEVLILQNEPWMDHLARLREIAFSNYKGLKYHVQYKLINAADFGVPQCRERVFIVGVRHDVSATWRWPRATHNKSQWKTLRDTLCGIPDPRDLSNDIPDHTFIDGARVYPGHTGSPLDKPCKTIKAGAHGVPGGGNMIRYDDGSVRYLTVFEAKTIQTFPANYKISGPWTEAMRQIGNAVPVDLATILGRELQNVLSADTGKPAEFLTDFQGNMLLLDRSKKKNSYSCRDKGSKRI